MPESSYTAAQASAVTGLPIRAILKAIEKDVIPSQRMRQDKTWKRMVTEAALVDAKGLNQLPLSFRRKTYRAILAHPQARNFQPVEAIQIDVEQARREIAASLLALRRAEQMVLIDADIMGGAPVIRGTRIPVHLVADMLSQGASPDEIVQGYPSLKIEQVRLAAMYAKAHPRRGRPASQAWKKRLIPVSRSTQPLRAEIADDVSHR